MGFIEGIEDDKNTGRAGLNVPFPVTKENKE